MAPTGSEAAAMGTAIRHARLASGLTLRAVAEGIGVSPATLSQIETGRTSLTVRRLVDVSLALGVPASDLLAASMRLEDAVTDSPGRASTADEPDWRDYGPLELGPVLQAALDEIVEVGYHGTSMRSIAGRCGLSVPGVYNYFESKQHMLMAIFDEMMTDMERRSHAAKAAGRTPVERFSHLVESIALFHTHRRFLGFVGATEMRALTDDNRVLVAARRDQQQAMVDEEVEAAVGEGVFLVEQPHEASRAVVTMCIALSSWWRPGGPLSAAEMAQEYVTFALDLMRCQE